ncbi:adenosylcobinamide-phosphate synthase CbiB [Agathobaculum desmolans]|uniref:adenosylcobinamide-phosphate synthase CbiB n=1 Tax=Agathobaculum desmolans TaxID=39484 RepID=UPI00248E310E|nr:adenosylcobinamide-phosphate synthase CbiB [Agathobaculum desmolans]
MYLTCVVLLGFALDWLLGDPARLPHPVCLIGWLITRGERILRRLFPKTPRGETIAGAVLWVLVCGVSFAVPFFALRWLKGIHFWLGCGAEILLCWLIFARKSLYDAGMDVYASLKRSTEEGRAAVAKYVGRDTAELDETGVICAAVETVAENTTDGVVAPLIFMLLGGAPLGMLYKAVNTLDSMVGYHNDRYEYFGKVSARMDDVFNFLPARLAAVCLIAGAGMLRLDNRNALCIFRRDRMGHKSPNAGQTESACAGALRIRLGGDASYFGKTVKKAAFGDADRQPNPGDILRAADLMTAASVLSLLLCAMVRLILCWPPFG